jgi:hypothetical protein
MADEQKQQQDRRDEQPQRPSKVISGWRVTVEGELEEMKVYETVHPLIVSVTQPKSIRFQLGVIVGGDVNAGDLLVRGYDFFEEIEPAKERAAQNAYVALRVAQERYEAMSNGKMKGRR